MSLINRKNSPCPVCGTEKRLAIGSPKEHSPVFLRLGESLDDFSVVRCADCALIYTFPIPEFRPELFKELYNLNYWKENDEVIDFKNMGEKRRFLKDALDRLATGSTPPRLLDVGCGTGEFLQASRELGIEALGIDVDASIERYAKEKYGFDVVTGMLDENSFEADRFDIVVLSHVIEHLPDPNPLLAVIRKILKPGGVFLVATPNADSFLCDLHILRSALSHRAKKGYNLTSFTPPFHLNAFNVRSLNAVLERNRFKVLSCSPYSGLDWKDDRLVVLMKTLKLIGHALGRGVNLAAFATKV